MSTRLALAFVMAGAGLACSHQQKIETTPPLAAVPKTPPPARPRPPVADTTEIVEAPKPKEGEAIFFDFDSALVKEDARTVLQAVAKQIRKTAASLEIDGNCDELGTVEYNLALGEHRARAAKDYLVHLGVPSNRIATVSFGSQRPKYTGHDDDARARNRRDDFVVR
jgi:peptidoglycan-associated lipoprotein